MGYSEGMEWIELHDYGRCDQRSEVKDFDAGLDGFRLTATTDLVSRAGEHMDATAVRVFLHKSGKTVVHEGYVTDASYTIHPDEFVTHIEANRLSEPVTTPTS